MTDKMIIWIGGIDLVFDKGEAVVGGMQVQMYMWAKTFRRHGWDVYAITKKRSNHKRVINDIHYLYYPNVAVLGPIISVLFSIYALISKRPNLVLVNGATRDLFFVALISRIIGTKVVSVFASDSDLEPGGELIKRKLDRWLYRNGLQRTQCFVVQNTRQSKLLLQNYQKNYQITVPSFWITERQNTFLTDKKDIILWVANFRSLKRPELFLEIARHNPDEKFVMIGNPTDKSLFDKCMRLALTLSNVKLIPGLGFNETDKYFEHAHLFICTSVIEGFPNSFLQAWMNGCPILSSFDPSDVIKANELGSYCTSIEDFNSGISHFKDPAIYDITSENCVSYFHNNHDSDTYYYKLIEHFKHR